MLIDRRQRQELPPGQLLPARWERSLETELRRSAPAAREEEARAKSFANGRRQLSHCDPIVALCYHRAHWMRGAALLELAAATRPFEHRIDAQLGASFCDATSAERAARITRVVKLIALEKEPVLRMLPRAYVDYAAGRLLRIYGGTSRSASTWTEYRFGPPPPRYPETEIRS
jgi:hypothetical protein